MKIGPCEVKALRWAQSRLNLDVDRINGGGGGETCQKNAKSKGTGAKPVCGTPGGLFRRGTNAVPAERHGTREGENSTGNAGAGGDGVADIRENASFKSGVGAKRRRAANLPEHISCRGALGQDNRGLACCGKRAPYLKNVNTAAVEREGSSQLRRRSKTIDARRERD